MSYDIVFQTKILKTDSGKVIHFSRNGCNNDEEGRKKDIYKVLGVYDSEEDFVKYANSLMEHSAPGDPCHWDLKIRSKYCTWYDYGKHLLTMLKRADTEKTLAEKYVFYAEKPTGITVLSPWEAAGTYSFKEYPDILHDLWDCKGKFAGAKAIRYFVASEYARSVKDFVSYAESEKNKSRDISFRISTKKA